jgi:hypothetical protein
MQEGTIVFNHYFLKTANFALLLNKPHIHARMGRQLRTLLNRVEFKDGHLRGSFISNIGTQDTNQRRYELLLSLKLRGDVLNGGITARSQGKCPCNALTHWVELKKGE